MRLFIIAILLYHGMTAVSQEIERYVIAAAGESFSNSSISLEWTLGESVTASFNDNDIFLSQGFHQTEVNPLLVRIGGTVFSGDLSVSEGIVMLKRRIDDNTFLEISQAHLQDNGIFHFSFIPASEYILYAIPEDLDIFYPTYYISTLKEDQAHVLPAIANVGGLDIELIPRLTSMENEFQIEDISVYPNPFTNIVSITLPEFYAADLVVKLMNTSGSVLANYIFTGEESPVLDLSDIPLGVYILNINTENYSSNSLIVKTK